MTMQNHIKGPLYLFGLNCDYSYKLDCRFNAKNLDKTKSPLYLTSTEGLSKLDL